jgi:hypothetical protein
MTKRMRYLLVTGFGAILVGCAASICIVHDSFHPLEACHRLLFERPQKHPPPGVWRNSQDEQLPINYRLPDSDMFFARYQGTESLFTEFRTNATYQAMIRMHAGSMLWDRGTWRLTDSGEMLMESEMRLHDLRSDDHWYIMVNSNTLADLPAIKTNVQNFLERRTTNTFSFAELEDIRRYPTYYNTNETFSAFTGYDWRPVDRASLEDFVGKIDEYLAWPEKNVFRLRPVTYASYVFLADLDSRFFSPEKQLSKMKKKVDDLRGKQIPSFIYVALTRDMFEAEAGRTEPFKFFKKPKGQAMGAGLSPLALRNGL